MRTKIQLPGMMQITEGCQCALMTAFDLASKPPSAVYSRKPLFRRALPALEAEVPKRTT